MIFKRVVAKLRAQDWGAITIELGIVVLGVFIGTLVANANQGRLQARETRQLLEQIKPDLERLSANFGYQERYYATTRRYADVALAGWRGDPKVSDRDFVIAAYQGSQIYALTFDSATWASIVGGDQVRSIDDGKLRHELAQVLYADYSPIKTTNLFTDYRKNVRRVIPLTIQERIRARCGDRTTAYGDGATLPATCDLAIDLGEAAAAAAKLRAHPELVDDLDYHFTVVTVALIASRGTNAVIQALLPDIDRYVGRWSAS